MPQITDDEARAVLDAMDEKQAEKLTREVIAEDERELRAQIAPDEENPRLRVLTDENQTLRVMIASYGAFRPEDLDTALERNAELAAELAAARAREQLHVAATLELSAKLEAYEADGVCEAALALMG